MQRISCAAWHKYVEGASMLLEATSHRVGII